MAETDDNIRREMAEREARKTPTTDQLLADLTKMKQLLYPLIEQAKGIDITARQVQHILGSSIQAAGTLNVSARHVGQDLQEIILPNVKKLIGLGEQVDELYNALSYYQTELHARGKK